MKKPVLHVVFPILAACLFSILSFLAARQNHVIDVQGWGTTSSTRIDWGVEPVDIGNPADALLLVLNLPSLIVLLPFSPLMYWVDSEVVLRAVWGLGAVGQWFLIGREIEIRRGVLAVRQPRFRLSEKKILVAITMFAGGLVFALGLYGAAAGRHSFWAILIDAGFVVWGIFFVVAALRWRSSFSAEEQFNFLRLS